MCEGGIVLISERVKQHVQSDHFFRTCTFPRFENNDFSEQTYIVDGHPGPLLDEQVPIDDARYLTEGLVQLCMRHGNDADLTRIDPFFVSKHIKSKYVLM